MSAARTAFDHGAAVRVDDERRLPLGPAEGWSSVLLLALMAALVGWAIDDSHWVLGNRTLTSFLPWAGVLGVLWGVVAAKVGRGRLLAHVGGAVVATTYLTLVVGAQLAPGKSIGGLFQATSNSVVEAYFDLVVRGRVTPSSFVVGFLPGLLATFVGAAISGTGVYKRQTAMLAKEALKAIDAR